MPTTEEVVEFILDVANKDDLHKISGAVSAKWHAIEAYAATKFYPGQRVRFTARDGRIVMGRVNEVLKKNIRVMSDGGTQWRVSPTLLQAVV